MLLLHISDIHFRFPVCTNPSYDADLPFRTMLVRDVQERVNVLGPVGAILVTGDIAYCAHPEEYQAAFDWLMELAIAGQCPKERVFVVPGNHDVDRSVIFKSPAVRGEQLAIKVAGDAKRERVLLEKLYDDTTGRPLFLPITTYNEFAKHFNCQIYPPDHLYWRQDLELEEGVLLRLHGLTSTLLSGAVHDADSQNDIHGSLYLSPLQTVLNPVEGVINLVMAHHPPDWFIDQDEVEDAIRGRAALHLFGHKHRQRIQSDNQYMRFSAGAVNPDRQERSWEPGYNLIKLAVVGGDGMGRSLQIEAHILKWQTDPDMYVPKETTEGDKIFRRTIRIPNKSTKRITQQSATPTVQSVSIETEVEAEVAIEVAMSTQSTRNLVMRFWNLSISQRREITLKLGLIVAADLKIPEPERYGRALRLAGERGILEQLAQEVEQRE